MTAHPRLIVSETTEKLPILIVDKNGILGEALFERLKKQFLIVLVTAKEIKPQENLVHIGYGKKIPLLPDEHYAAMLILFHGEKTTLDILPSIAKKANEANTKLLFITSLYYADKKLEKLLQKNEYAKTIKAIYGEIIEKDELFPNLITNYIHEVRVSKKIEIPGNGLQKSYPVLLEDVCDAIISITFEGHKKTKPVLILPRHGFTQLAIARAFQKLDPLIKVNFKKDKNKETEYNFPNDSEYFFSAYEIEKKLKKIDLSKKGLPPDWNESGHTKRPKKYHIKRIKGRKKYLPLFLFLLFFLLPIFFQFLLLIAGSLFLSQSIKTAQNYNISSAKEYSFLAKASFSAALFLSQNASGVNPVLFMQKEPISKKAQIGQNLSEAESNILESASLIGDIYEDKSLDPKNDFLQAMAKIKNSLITMQKLKAEKEIPVSLQQKISSLEPPLTLLGNIIDTLPDLLGFNQKKKYLILFQNNMELRPGGGFIGSYATFEIRNGKTSKLQINDVYDADGKLSVHIEPPFALRRYLGAPHLFLRDSNFDIDFIANAKKAQSFLELETGEKTDGVIAIDTEFVKSMIEVFGPLYIPDFKETITADNFYLATETHAEKNFFPGSTQKKDFLRALYNTLESKITQSKKIPFSLLAQKINDNIKQKHLLIAFPDSEMQTIFTANNLSGGLVSNRQKKDNEFSDFLGINEANLGMNKTNFYLKRSIEQKVSIDASGSATETINIIYENSGNKTSPFAGDYKNYLRYILPQNAILKSVQVNNSTIPTTEAITNINDYTRKGFVPPPQLEVEKNQVGDKITFGFLVIIPMSTSQKISITYSLPNAINPNSAVMNYDLYLLKQAGTGNDAFSFSLAYPRAFRPIYISPGFVDVGGKLVYMDVLSEDKNLILNFSKK